MRRKDKEIVVKNLIEKILSEAQIIRIAMYDGSEPYLVAMNFAYSKGCIYLHSAKEGRKNDILNKNNLVAFQTDTGVELVQNKDGCYCTMKYNSVFGTGYATLIDKKEAKIKALNAIMTKYTGRDGSGYPEKVIDRTLVIKVDIITLSGKRSG